MQGCSFAASVFSRSGGAATGVPYKIRAGIVPMGRTLFHSTGVCPYFPPSSGSIPIFQQGLSLFPSFLTGVCPYCGVFNRGLSLLWGLSLFPFRGLSPFPAPLSLPRSSAPGASLFCMGGRRAAPLPGLFPAHVAFPRLLPLRVRIKKRRPESLRSFPASPPSRQ